MFMIGDFQPQDWGSTPRNGFFWFFIITDTHLISISIRRPLFPEILYEKMFVKTHKKFNFFFVYKVVWIRLKHKKKYFHMYKNNNFYSF